MIQHDRPLGTAFLLAVLCLGPFACSVESQNVGLSLNVFPTSHANPNGGGTWALVAKTDATHGISSVNVYISGINTSGILYGAGINAELIGGNPVVFPGTPVNLLYHQGIDPQSFVIGVGTPAFSSSLDPLGNPTWDHATNIATGTYSGALPFFAPRGSNITDANVFSASTPSLSNILDANTTFLARVALTGDYDRNAVVNAADYAVWRNSLGSTASLAADGDANGLIDSGDYAAWRINFGRTTANGAALPASASLLHTVPEPSTLFLTIAALAAFSVRRRKPT